MTKIQSKTETTKLTTKDIQSSLYNRYYDFLIDFWTLSKKEPISMNILVNKHKISNDVMTILKEFGYVIKNGTKYNWNTTKPNKLMTNTIIELVKEHKAEYKANKNNKSSNTYEISNDLIQFSSKDKFVDTSKVLDQIVEQELAIDNLEKEISYTVSKYTALEESLKQKTQDLIYIESEYELFKKDHQRLSIDNVILLSKQEKLEINNKNLNQEIELYKENFNNQKNRISYLEKINKEISLMNGFKYFKKDWFTTFINKFNQKLK